MWGFRIVSWRRAIVAAVLAGLLAGPAAPPVSAQQEATFSGGILDPVGKPQPGFRLVLRDVKTGREFVSGETGAGGEYSLSVPVGAQYKVAGVVAPDGTRLAVQDLPPISVRVPGKNHLDIRFQARPIPSPAEAATAGGEGDEEKKRRGVPWWKTPGGVTGIVVGAAAVTALALGGGGDGGDSVSPSQR